MAERWIKFSHWTSKMKTEKKRCTAFHNSISMHIKFLFRTCRVKHCLGHLFPSFFGIYKSLPKVSGFLLCPEVLVCFSLVSHTWPKDEASPCSLQLHVHSTHVYENLLQTSPVPVSRLCNKLLFTYILFLVLCPCEQGFIFRE